MGRTLMVATADGPTLTAAAAASCIPTNLLTTVQAGYWQVGKTWHIVAAGRISCVITTPGTFRLDLRMGAVTVFDTLALPLNTVAQTTVPWFMEFYVTCRVAGSGTAAQLFGQGTLRSTAFLAVPAVATGPWAGAIVVPYNVAPALGTGFDSTIANAFDFRFTQTAATGSFTLHSFVLEEIL
jgi:hypothetical protein